MELPALKVGKPRPTPVVRGGITYDDYFNYCYSKQHPDEYYMCWGREFRELPEGAYAIWPKPHIIYNDNWKRLDSLFPCDIYKPNKKFLINGHIYYSCFY